jgi:S-adenosylmethionine/arginine decarboxylase-like enzyme
MNNINLLTAILISVASVIHLYRVVSNSSMIIGAWNVPMGVSWVLFVIAGFLAVHFWKNIK